MRAYAKITIVIALLLVAVVAVQVTLQTTLLRIEKIQVQASPEYQEMLKPIKKDLLPKIESLKGKWLWQVSIAEILEHIQSDRRVRHAQVHRKFPGSLSVVIEPHLPVLLLPASKGSWVPVGRDASLLSRLKLPMDLPILRGKKFFENSKLRERAVDLMTALPSSGLFQSDVISEVKFDNKKGFQLFLTNGFTHVNMGHEDFNKRVIFVERVLNYLKENQLQARVIDARFSKKVVVRLRNAS